MDADFVLTQIMNGLSVSVILILFSLGLSIVFGLMRIVNMAHGEFFILGAYTQVVLLDSEINFWLGLVIAPLTLGLIGAVLYLGLVRRIQTSITDTLLVTWGVSIIIRQLLEILFSPRPRNMPSPLQGSVDLLITDYPAYRTFVLVSGALLVAVLIWGYLRTSLGLQVRAAIHDAESTAMLGINTRQISTGAFVLGAALAGLGGALLSPMLPVQPAAGLNFLIVGFFVVLVGGAGVMGTVAGALLLGGGQSYLEFGLSPLLAQIVVLVGAVGVLLLRPQGLVRQL